MPRISKIGGNRSHWKDRNQAGKFRHGEENIDFFYHLSYTCMYFTSFIYQNIKNFITFILCAYVYVARHVYGNQKAACGLSVISTI